MLAKLEELNITNKELEIKEYNGIVILKSNSIKKDVKGADLAYTKFLRCGNKAHDISGYTTGIGLYAKEVFKIAKKKNSIRFNSDFLLKCQNPKCMESIIVDIENCFDLKTLEIIENSKYFFIITDHKAREFDEIGNEDLKDSIFVSIGFV